MYRKKYLYNIYRMAEIQSISGNHIYSAEFKEKTMEAYNNFYKNLNQNYIRDEFYDMMWLPNPRDIWKFDTKIPSISYHLLIKFIKPNELKMKAN